MAYRRIHSKGPYQYEEATVGTAISPGMLAALDTRGQLKPHDEEGGRGEVAFAIEDVLQGLGCRDLFQMDRDELIPGDFHLLKGYPS